MRTESDGVREQQPFFAARARAYATGYEGTESFRARVQQAVSTQPHGDVLDLGNGGLLGSTAPAQRP